MIAILLAALQLGAADSGRTISRETFDATDGVQVVIRSDCRDLTVRKCLFIGGKKAQGAIVVEPGARNIRIENNAIGGYDGAGVTLSGDVVFTGNLVRNTRGPALAIAEPGRVTVENNVLSGTHAGLLSVRQGTGVTFVRNILYWSTGDALAEPEAAQALTAEWTNNQWCNREGDGKVRIGGLDFKTWQAKGKDVGGLEEDSLLTDPDGGNYRVRPDAPAVKLGFRRFDPFDVGPAVDWDAYRYPKAALSKEDERYRRSYVEMRPVTADGMERKRPEIRNGTWYVDGHPVYYFGVWLYNRTEMDWNERKTDKLGIDHIAYRERPGTNVFAAVGMNSAQLSCAQQAPTCLLHGAPQKKPFAAEERRTMDFYRGFGDMPWVVDFAFLPTGIYPDNVRFALDQKKFDWHAFVSLCPEHPEGKSFYRDAFVGGSRNALRAGANVYLWELFNESSYNCQCADNRREFLRRLKGKYGPETDFERVMDDPALWYDWCVFSAARYNEVLAEARDWIRETDRRARVYFTEQASGTPPVHRGMDLRGADALEALSIEGGWQYGFSSDYRAKSAMEAVVATRGSKHFYNCDFYQALARQKGKVIVNNEHYCTRIENGLRVRSKKSDYLTSLWLELMHGVSSTYIYVWDKRSFDYQDLEGARRNVVRPSYKSSSLLNPHNVAPEDLDLFGTFQRELAPYRDRVMPFPRVKPATVAVFFSKPTEIQRDRLPRLDPTLAKWRSQPTAVGIWYVKLLHALYPVKVVFEEDLDALGPEVAALVLPDSQYVLPEVVGKVRAFKARGGTVICGKDALSFDAWGRPLPRTEGLVRTDDADAAVAELVRAGVRRYAELEPTDGGEALKAADVQVCDRGDFKLVTVVDMAARTPRSVRLRLRHLDGTGPWTLKDAVTGEVLSPRIDAKGLSSGVTFVLPPQERKVLCLEP